jgi:hypothetical protein
LPNESGTILLLQFFLEEVGVERGRWVVLETVVRILVAIAKGVVLPVLHINTNSTF